MQLKDDFANLRIIKLEQNYRSAGRILKAANRLIANNPHVFDKALWSELGYGDPIRVIRARDEEAEAQEVVAQLLHHKFTQRTAFRDYAILYRGNHQSRPFERVLREHDIPYHLSGGMSFFAYSEIKDIMAYLRLLSNPDDDNAFLRVANTPRREIGPSTIEKLARYAAGRNVSLFAASLELGLEAQLSARAAERLRNFAEFLVRMSDRAQREDPVSVARDMIDAIDYERYLYDTSSDEQAAERRIANVNELIEWLSRLAAQKDTGATLGDLVERLTLLDILERDDEEDKGDRVNLMTLHAAKGLEFPHVYLAGMEEQLLPHRSSVEEDNVEEERRLAYVGVTRAQKTLTLTLATQRKRYGEVIDCEPSRFLNELPEEDLRWEGQGIERDPAERQERGQAHLANLRGILQTS